MADTGFKWGGWTALTAFSLANSADSTTAAVTMATFAAAEVGLACATSNSAVSGVETIYVLGDVDGTNYETQATASFAFSLTPVQASTVYKRFEVNPRSFGSFKVNVDNASGTTTTITLKYRTATVPVAS